MTSSPLAQTQYQVRFDWGSAGAQAIGDDVDVLIWVDALGSSPVPAIGPGRAVLASLRNRRAVAEWVLAQQGGKGERFVVAVVGAGEAWPDGSSRFAVEDLLAAGALIDALADLGIDYCSPEAAAAAAAFTGMRNAVRHLIRASASGRAAIAEGLEAEVDAAIALDSVDEVVLAAE